MRWTRRRLPRYHVQCGSLTMSRLRWSSYSRGLSVGGLGNRIDDGPKALNVDLALRTSGVADGELPSRPAQRSCAELVVIVASSPLGLAERLPPGRCDHRNARLRSISARIILASARDLWEGSRSEGSPDIYLQYFW